MLLVCKDLGMTTVGIIKDEYQISQQKCATFYVQILLCVREEIVNGSNEGTLEWRIAIAGLL